MHLVPKEWTRTDPWATYPSAHLFSLMLKGKKRGVLDACVSILARDREGSVRIGVEIL